MAEWINSLQLYGNIDIINGGTPKTDEPRYWNGSIGWLSVEDFNNGYRFVFDAQKTITEKGLKHSSTTILNRGQIIISARGTVGIVAQIGSPLAFNQSCYGINSTRYWTNDYLYYYLLFIADRIRAKTHGNVFGTITKETFKDIAIPILPIPEQSKIVDVLSTLDDVIDKTRALIAKYKNIKAGMTQDLLMNGIDENGVIRSPKTHEYKDSPLGRIPVEWDCRRFDKVMPLQRGHDLPQHKIIQGEYPVACSNGIVSMHNKYTTKGPCVWTGRSGTIGNVFYLEQNCWIHNTSLWVTNFCGNDEKFIYYLLSSFDIKKHLAGTGVPTLNRNDLHFQQVLLPKNKNEQKRIAERLIVADKKIQTERDYLVKLQNIKQGLMQDLLTNTVSVDAVM